jgi:hypothetical protein
MRGGIYQSIGARSAHRSIGLTILGILSVLVVAVRSGYADERYGDENCQPQTPQEQSIIVSSERSDSEDSEYIVATDQGEEALEPIANVSEQVPDLAEPELAEPTAQLTNPVADGVEEEKAEEVSTVLVEPESDVISFEGITPGISHRREVFRTWGDPRSEETTAATLEYRFDRFQGVEVSFDHDIVDAILVRLENPLPLGALTTRLGLEKIRPAELTDEQGAVLAQAYPERGVVLRLADDELSEGIASDSEEGLRVGEIVIQPIKASAFLLRAENALTLHPSQSMSDLKAALKLDHTSAHARWLLAELEMSRGKAVAAERYASEASELDPENLAFRLQWARCLRQLAQYDRAVAETRTVLQSPTAEPLLRAEALYEMGLLAALGSQEIAKNALALHQKAIAIADELAAGDDAQIRRAANRLLVDAHLAMAVEIARGPWEQKMETVPRWIERASALAEGMIAEDPSQLHLRLRVAVSALAAAANLEKTIDPLLWIEEAEQTAKLLRKSTDDPQFLDEVDWKLGFAYFQAAQIEHRRSAPDSALRLGKLADAKLGEIAKQRDELPDTAYLMGRLYFQIGAVYAVHQQDHKTACEWYNQAADRLLNPVPVTTMATPQQHGDALVSMGVSYWDTGQRQRAIQLTQAGVQLIERAVSSGLLTDEALVIPYGNLAAMYEAAGEKEPAAKYTALAQKITGSTVE